MRRLIVLAVLCFSMTGAAAWGRVVPAQLTSSSPQSAPHSYAKPKTHMSILMGRRTIRRGVRQQSTGRAEAFRFQETVAGTARSISVYVPAHSSAKTLATGLYTNRGGGPGRRLASGSTRVPARGGWVAVGIKPTALAKGRAYWIAALGRGGTLVTRTAHGPLCRSATVGAGGLATLPQSWAQGTRSRTCVAAYVSGSPASAPSSSTSTPPSATTGLAPTTGTTPAPGSGSQGPPSSGGGSSSSPGGSPSSPGLHVVGNKLVNASGQTVVLHGTDVSGSSYACEQNGGYGFSDTPTGNSLFGPMVSNDGGALPAKWTINSVTLLLNQDCWLGINGVPAQYSGQNYINFVKAQVASMESYGIYPVLVFGEGTDSGQPNYYNDDGQVSMPNNNHFPLLFEELATEFKNDPNVIFRLFEEPFPDWYSGATGLSAWKCWSQGDDQYATTSDSTLPAGWESSPGTQTAPTPTSSTSHCNETDGNGVHFATVGMQSLVNIIRGTGASNIIQIPGVAYANALSCTNTGSPVSCGFLDSADGVRVNDTLNTPQLMADTDNYPDIGQFVNSTTSLTDTYGPVAAVMPIDMGEAGTENGTMTLIQEFIAWYDSEGQSYYGSQWETWSSFVSNYNGTPGTGWGTWYYDHITGATCSVTSGC